MKDAATACTVDRDGLRQLASGKAFALASSTIRPPVRLAPPPRSAIADPLLNTVVPPRLRRGPVPRRVVAVVAMCVAIACFFWLVELAADILGDGLIATVGMLTAALHVIIIVERLLGPCRLSRSRY